MQALVDLVYRPRSAWGDDIRGIFSEVLRERFRNLKDVTDRKNDERNFQLRFNGQTSEDSVPYVALIPSDQELSGPYGGMSFVIFPADEDGAPALIAMGIGTNGLSPDEAILGRPGHARKCTAICDWLNHTIPAAFAWAKRDPVRIDRDLPEAAQSALGAWANTCKKYGPVLYAVFAPPTDRSTQTDAATLNALTAFIDLFFHERRVQLKTGAVVQADRIRTEYMKYLMPTTSDDDVVALLKERRFVVIEGPPGTGKTEMARRVLKDRYGQYGSIIQFHPSIAYEQFVGGLAPVPAEDSSGLAFAPTPGHLMRAAAEAAKRPKDPYLLVIDEINRADLAKVLGEAIYLLEPKQPDRWVQLPYEFVGFTPKFTLPENLHILGTMNSADRSIAILDVAVRRRFAFTQLWPQLAVVEAYSAPTLVKAFQELLTIFIEHAHDDALPLVPGHSYFLGNDEQAQMLLNTGLRPLLEEYLAQGYVAPFADEVRAYIDAYTKS